MPKLLIDDIDFGFCHSDLTVDVLKLMHPNAKKIEINFSTDEALVLIRNAHSQMMTAAIGNASEIERDTWPVQLQAAVAIKTGTATPSQQNMATNMLVSGETISSWASKVTAKNEAMQALIGAAQGIKRRAEKAVEAAVDAAAIAAALDDAKKEADAAMRQFASQ